MRSARLFLAALTSLSPFAFVSCSAGAVQRDAVCERSSALDLAVTRAGQLATGVKSLNAAVLRSQLDEDLANLTAALDVAPRSVASDISILADRLRALYGALELLDWNSVEFVSDERLNSAVSELDSVNTRRHLARLTDYLLKDCDAEPSDFLPPPDSVIATQLPPTSIAAQNQDPVAVAQDPLTAYVALGTAIAESVGAKVTVPQAQCLGEAADSVSLSADQAVDGNYSDLFAPIFAKCGVNVSDRPTP